MDMMLREKERKLRKRISLLKSEREDNQEAKEDEEGEGKNEQNGKQSKGNGGNAKKDEENNNRKQIRLGGLIHKILPVPSSTSPRKEKK